MGVYMDGHPRTLTMTSVVTGANKGYMLAPSVSEGGVSEGI